MSKLRDLVQFWPPEAWSQSYSGGDPLIVDISNATVESAVVRKGVIQLTINHRNGSATAAVLIKDSNELNKIAAALSTARGKTLEEAGAIEV